MIRDPVILGATAGLLGAVAKAAVNHLAFLAGLANVSVLHVTQRVAYHAARPLTGVTLLISFAVFVLFGSLFGVILAYGYIYTGTDHRYLKGAGFGWLAYYLMENFAAPVVQPGLDLPSNDGAVIASLLTHLLYGLVTAYAMSRLGTLPVRTRE